MKKYFPNWKSKMAEITNEQEIWGILHDHVSPDDVWKKRVATYQRTYQ